MICFRRTPAPGFGFIYFGFLLICSTQASLCEEPLTIGMQQFNSGNFSAAKPQLELAVKQHPKSAKLQYLLGNTYFQLGSKAQAQQAYEACLSLSPDATISSYCQKMLSHLKPVTSSKPSSDATGSASDQDSAPNDAKQAKVAARRKEIMRRAEEECNKVRRETKEQMAEAEANGNRWVRSIERNDVHPTISREERAAIESESDQKISRIMNSAKRQANLITIP